MPGLSLLWVPTCLIKKSFINPQYSWFADSTGLTFITQSPDAKVFNKLDWQTMKIAPLFDHARLAKLLSDSLKKEIKPTDLPLGAVKYIDRSHIEFNAAGKDYLLDLNAYALTTKMTTVANSMEIKSPDGKWLGRIY